jgi:hypothetical protein
VGIAERMKRGELTYAQAERLNLFLGSGAARGREPVVSEVDLIPLAGARPRSSATAPTRVAARRWTLPWWTCSRPTFVWWMPTKRAWFVGASRPASRRTERGTPRSGSGARPALRDGRATVGTLAAAAPAGRLDAPPPAQAGYRPVVDSSRKRAGCIRRQEAT